MHKCDQWISFIFQNQPISGGVISYWRIMVVAWGAGCVVCGENNIAIYIMLCLRNNTNFIKISFLYLLYNIMLVIGQHPPVEKYQEKWRPEKYMIIWCLTVRKCFLWIYIWIICDATKNYYICYRKILIPGNKFSYKFCHTWMYVVYIWNMISEEKKMSFTRVDHTVIFQKYAWRWWK